MARTLTTKDGSHTLVSHEFGEHYHSTHGAITESQHVFIQSGLFYLLQKGYTTISILEIGFGTGLNALLTALESQSQQVNIHYTAYEKYPITAGEAKTLNYADLLHHADAHSLMAQVHDCVWESPVQIEPLFTIEKRQQNFNQLQDVDLYDCIYMDAFAPAAQLEFWEAPFLQKLSDALKSGGILVTYCAKGSFKRALKATGFSVESIPGPPGKREMTRAHKV